MAGNPALISYRPGPTSSAGEGTASWYGIEGVERTISRFTGRPVRLTKGWGITGTCSPRLIKLGRLCGRL